ncbi:NAD(P)-binding protein [bacterium]|nr:NAD(P)-binding protein [bacterium]
MKVAVIGSGISGLYVTNALHGFCDITLFEAEDRAGGHTNTFDVTRNGRTWSIDTGFIVYNDRTYPNFIALLESLGVVSKPTIMSFSVHDEATGLEYNGHSPDTLFAQRSNLFRPKFHRLLWDIVRFNRLARVVADAPDDGTTVGQFLDTHRFSRAFRELYLLPMGAAIWSCPTGTFGDFPIRFIAEFYRNHGLLDLRDRPQWRVIQGGSRNYVDVMTRGFRDRIRLNSPIASVRRQPGHVEVTPVGGAPEIFDHVIFACHSDQALKILGENATTTERQILSRFPYSRNVAVLHTDESLLPVRRKAWASWNYRVTGDPAAPASVTYDMNILQGLDSETTFCVTLNDEKRIDPAKVIERFVYHHPIFTSDRAAAQARHHELIGPNRTSFCGAYWRNGFHEDGVVSAQRVVESLKARLTDPVRVEPVVATGVTN